MFGKILSMAYGIVSYILFLGSFLYAIGFVGDLVVPKTINTGPEASTFGQALLINALLLGLFAVQHSVMARRWFKEWWTRIVPEHLERSTYVLFSSLALFLLYWLWRPMPEVIWSVEPGIWSTLLTGLFWLGWLIVLSSSWMINHFDLFGLRQVWLHLKDREYKPVGFQKPALYKYVRHPLMLGFLIAFWATPEMTVGHLVFSIATTGYIFIGIWLEERDLVHHLGDEYRKYRERVSMVFPFSGAASGTSEPEPSHEPQAASAGYGENTGDSAEEEHNRDWDR